MIQLDEAKLAELPTTNQLLDDKYGAEGTPARNEFNAKAIAWYYGSLLRDRRKELKLKQREVAEKIGGEQTYIARVERGLFPHSCRPWHSVCSFVCFGA